MTITISQQAADDLDQATEATAQIDPSDPLDRTYLCPTVLGHGYNRLIELRPGLEIRILQARLRDRTLTQCRECFCWLEYHFHLWGQHADQQVMVGDREFALYGGGLFSQQVCDGPEQTALEVVIYLQPKMLLSFIGDANGQLPQSLQHLLRPAEQEQYARVAKITPTMEGVLWQIVRCSQQGLLKRLYLEGKALELVSLVLEQESEIQTGQRAVRQLSAGTLERIHYAKTLLLMNVQEPPSLPELAQQAKLNEYTLKRGFKQVFGTTVFSYLHDYRLEQAEQLLKLGQLSVSEVMMAVGFGDRQHFAAAFRKKFGVSPRECLTKHRRS